jgi:hypothetical protein
MRAGKAANDDGEVELRERGMMMFILIIVMLIRAMTTSV